MKDEIVFLNFLGIVTIKIQGKEESINNLKSYFPNLIASSSSQYDYFINQKENEFCKISIPDDSETIYPFKATPYIVFDNNNKRYAYSINNDEFSSDHLIERDNKNITIYSFGNNCNMLETRVCREIIFRKLIDLGYIPIHASSSCFDDEASLYIGQGGNGKSTCMIYNVLLNNERPIGNDVVMVKKNDDNINVIGMPFKVSISGKMINSFGYKFKTSNDKKLRFGLLEFQQNFNKKWKWKANLKKIYLLNYNKEIDSYFINNMSEEEFDEFIDEVLVEENFQNGDYLGIACKNPETNYKFLKDNSVLIEGNVLQYFKRGNNNGKI